MHTEMADEVVGVLCDIKREEENILQLKDEFIHAQISVKRLEANSEELDQRKAAVTNEIKHLLHQIEQEGSRNSDEKLKLLLNFFRDMERKDYDFHFPCKQEYLSETLVTKKLLESNNVDDSLHVSVEKLNLAKKELAAKLRANLLLKRRLLDVASQSELIQYEHRFSELYVQIQEKLRQTRKYYATYNALLEIKELMLKEVSLLNSINAQFQDAITSTAGRTKLIDSMEGILKGTQQKLEKVQLGLQTEQKNFENLKQKYGGSIAEQRHRSSLLKSFEEEYERSERLGRASSSSANFVS